MSLFFNSAEKFSLPCRVIETSCAERKGICRLKELVRQLLTDMQGNASFSPGLMITQVSN